MSDPLKRALRGFIQIGVVTAALQLYQAFAATPLTEQQMAAITLFATPLLAFVQNALEDSGTIPTVAK